MESLLLSPASSQRLNYSLVVLETGSETSPSGMTDLHQLGVCLRDPDTPKGQWPCRTSCVSAWSIHLVSAPSAYRLSYPGQLFRGPASAGGEAAQSTNCSIKPVRSFKFTQGILFSTLVYSSV